MPPDGVVTARPERLLHPRTGVAEPRPLEQRAADPKAAVLEREQVDAGDDQVAPEPFGGGVAPGERGDDRQVFGLEKRHLPRRVRRPNGPVVARETAPRQREGALHAHRFRTPRRAQEDQLEPPPLRQRV